MNNKSQRTLALNRTCPGWCDFENIYKGQVQLAPHNQSSVFVEIGCCFGLSAIKMAEFIRDSGKPITFYTVDPFDESILHKDILAHLEYERKFQDGYVSFNELASAFINKSGVSEFVTVVQSNSTDFAETFPDGRIDFVFIDGDHRFFSAQNDLRAWWPKLKNGAWIGGHDISLDDVRLAVNVTAKMPWIIDGSSWMIWKKEWFHRPFDPGQHHKI